MKKRSLLLIIASIIIIIAACILIIPNIVNRNSDKSFSIPDPDLITKVFITNKQNESTLLERNGMSWIVNSNSEAFNEAVINMLVATKRLKVRGPVPEASFNTIVAQLANTSTKVEFYANDYKINFLGIKLFPIEKKINSFYVGGSTMDNEGTYMIKEGASRPYVVYIPGYRGFVAPYYTPDPNVWLSHVIFCSRIPQIASIQYVNNEKPEESYLLKNIDSRNFILSSYPDNVALPSYDTVKVMDLLSSFSDIRFEAALDDDKYDDMNVDSILKTVPAHEIILTDYNGIQSIAKTFRIPLTQRQKDDVPIGQEEPPYDLNNIYVWVKTPSFKKDANGNVIYNERFVLGQYFSFDAILHKLSYFKQ